MESRDPALVNRVQKHFGVDEEDKAVERVRRAITLVILWIDGPNGAPEDTFFGSEMMIADGSREWGELTVLWWKGGYTPWRGVTVNSQVPEQISRFELGKQES